MCFGLGGRRKHTLQDNPILQARILTLEGSSGTLGIDNTFGEVGLAAYAHSYPSMGLCHRRSREGSKDRFGRRAFEREDLFGPQNHLSERELLIAEGDE